MFTVYTCQIKIDLKLKPAYLDQYYRKLYRGMSSSEMNGCWLTKLFQQKSSKNRLIISIIFSLQLGIPRIKISKLNSEK